MVNLYFPNKFVIKYKSSDDIIKIFGKKFVEKNENNFILIINEKIFKLSEYINIKKIYENKNINNLEVILCEKEKKKVNDISYMFYELE
jgi:hypothetical protein